MATGYVANWGNDNNDGLTWETAKKTISAGHAALLTPMYVKGWYNEEIGPLTSVYHLYGIDFPILSGKNINFKTSFGALGVYFNDMIIEDFESIISSGNQTFMTRNCLIRNGTIYENRPAPREMTTSSCILYNITNVTLTEGSLSATVKEGTFFNIDNLIITWGNDIPTQNLHNIFSDIGNFEFKSIPSYVKFCLFNGSIAYKFTGGGLGSDESSFTVLTGADDAAKLANFKARLAITYGGATSDYLEGCVVDTTSYTNTFLDADNGAFNLVPGCQATYMSYQGRYVGARPEGIYFRFPDEWNNLVNIGTPGYVTDQTDDVTVDSDIKDIGRVQILKSLTNLGTRAARNGMQINTVRNLGSPGLVEASPFVPLTDGKAYIVMDDTITLNDGGATTYNPYDTFTAEEEGTPGSGAGLEFTGNGTVYEVLTDDADMRPKIQIKASKTDSLLSTAALLTFYENDIPMVNVDANGEPTYGNADSGYVSGNAVPFSTRYFKIFMKIKADQLTIRY